MIRGFTLLGVFVALLASTWSAAAEDVASSIVGVWKMSDLIRKETATGTTEHRFGEHPEGIAIYTKGGHFTVFVTAQGRKAPAKPADADRVELFRTMYGFGGTYKVDGNKITLHIDNSWNQVFTGTDRPPAVVEIKGKQMTITSSPLRSPQGGEEIIVTTTWERAE
jgi:hypothetical protein